MEIKKSFLISQIIISIQKMMKYSYMITNLCRVLIIFIIMRWLNFPRFKHNFFIWLLPYFILNLKIAKLQKSTEKLCKFTI